MHILTSFMAFNLLVVAGQIIEAHFTRQADKHDDSGIQLDNKAQDSDTITSDDNTNNESRENAKELRLVEELLGGVGGVLDSVVGLLGGLLGTVLGGLTSGLGEPFGGENPTTTTTTTTTTSARPTITTVGGGVNQDCLGVEWPDPFTCSI